MLRFWLRISELLSIKVGDVIEHSGRLADRIYIRRQNVKGKVEGRSIPLHAAARDALADWLSELQGRGIAKRDAFVFCGQKGCWHAVSTVQAWRVLRDAFVQAGLSGQLGTHTMRKTFAAAMYRGLDHDLVLTQKALGHRNVNSTISYLNASQGRIDAAMTAMSI